LEDEDLTLLGKDSLLGQVVVELSLGESLGDTALGVQNSGLSGSELRESLPGVVLDGSLGGLVGGEAGQGGGRAPDEVLLGTDDVSGSGDVRDGEEPVSLVAEWVVDALGVGESSRELGHGQSGTGQSEDDQGVHLVLI